MHALIGRHSKKEEDPKGRSVMTRYLCTVLLLITIIPASNTAAQTANDVPLMKIGWTENTDQSIDVIIQLNPSVPTNMLEALSNSQRSELVIGEIPEFIKHDFENIILTVGSGPVTRVPSAEELQSRYAVKQRNALANTGGVVTGDLSSQNRIQPIDQPRGRTRETTGSLIGGSDNRPTANSITAPSRSTPSANSNESANFELPTDRTRASNALNGPSNFAGNAEAPSLPTPNSNATAGLDGRFSNLDKERRWENTNPQNRRGIGDSNPNLQLPTRSTTNSPLSQLNDRRDDLYGVRNGDQYSEQPRNPFNNRDSSFIATDTRDRNQRLLNDNQTMPRSAPGGFSNQQQQYERQQLRDPRDNQRILPGYSQPPNARLAMNGGSNIYEPGNNFIGTTGNQPQTNNAVGGNADMMTKIVGKFADENSQLKQKNDELQKQLEDRKLFAETQIRSRENSLSDSVSNTAKNDPESKKTTSQSSGLFIPALLILSVVLNGYAIIVISNLLQRYRSLLSNVRTNALA